MFTPPPACPWEGALLLGFDAHELESTTSSDDLKARNQGWSRICSPMERIRGDHPGEGEGKEKMGDYEHHQDSTSKNPSHNNNAPLAIESAPCTGKGQAASSSTKSTKRKAIEGYRLYYSERTGSSFLQTGNKRRVVSFGTSKSKAKASADGNASVVIETSAGRASSSARATIKVTGGRATAKIKSSSTGRGGQKKAG